jgi:uncharacterized iron-regulated protein
MSFSDDKPAYKIFSESGKEVKYSKMIEALDNADIVVFGEFHNNPICHWLEFEVTKDLSNINPKGITLGAEMFEADNQLIIDEYLQGYMKDNKFEEEARLWPNYKTDYQPLISFAKEKKLRFIATNVPRRYANLVYRSGFEVLDSLSEQAKNYISPLPVLYDSTLNCYADLIAEGKKMGHDNPNLPKAQALKDATMAYFILKNKEKKKLFIHYNGSYHTDRFEGIVWYLKKADNDLKILTISTVEQDNIEELKEEDKGLADYIIAVPESMTKTYIKN